MNKKGQLSVWGIIYGVVCLILSIVIVRLMNPGWFWGIVTIAVTTIGGYIVGLKASGD